MMSDGTSDALRSHAFREEERKLRLLLNRAGCAIALLLMPLGSVLDYSAYPDLFRQFAFARTVCEVLLGCVGVGLLLPRTKSFGAFWAACLGTIPTLTMCYMIFRADGAHSNYYVGLIIALVAVCLLMSSTVEAVLFSAFVIFSYCAACVFNPTDIASPQTLGMNAVYLCMIGAVCSVVCGLSEHRRKAQFVLSYVLDQRNAELAELNRRKSQFFANVSHELRTPLTLILGPTEGLLHRVPPLPDSAGNDLLTIRRNGLRLLRLIDDLLDLIRVENAGVRLERRPLSLRKLLNSVVDSMRPLAQQKSIHLSLLMECDSLVVSGDESRLERAFLNLAHNAVKYTPKDGSVQIQVAKTDNAAVVKVIDSGIGIPPKDIPRIFERYYQANDPRIRGSQGLGIGLHLTRELILAHEGAINVENNVAVGATFTVTLPLEGGHLAAEAGTSVAESPRASEPTASAITASDRPGFAKVLVVDDEPDMREYLHRILKDKYDVYAVADAESGLESAKIRSFDAVLMDLMLPGMDGIEACLKFRGETYDADLKILMLTAKIDEGTKIAALRNGADDFLTKPFSEIEALTRVEKLLETSALQKKMRQRNRELEEALARLKAAETQLVQSEKMNSLGTLAAGLLHEINNPLNYSLVALKLVSRSAENAEFVKENTECALEGLQRINSIISDLRTFAYPETANYSKPFDLGKAVECALRFTAHEAQDVAVSQDVSISRFVVGAFTPVTQVLVNLICNAVDSVRKIADIRPPTIRISVREEGASAIVQIQDNGIGIPKDIQEKLFEPFFTTKDDGRHVGLGLSICVTVLRQHGSRLVVESEPGLGATMTFSLPLDNREGSNNG